MRLIILLLLSLPLTLKAQTYSEKRYELVVTESTVKWHGEDFVGAGSHDGTLQLTSGYLIATGTVLIKGDFVLDMTTIRNTDQRDEGGRRDLEEHLKGTDFFETDKFPKAFFAITKAVELHDPLKPDQYTITGFLGIKGITNVITFPATLRFTANTLKANATIKFDRTKWNVTYQSKTIFTTLKDGALSDYIKIDLDMSFKAR